MTQTLPKNWEQIVMEFPETEVIATPDHDEMEPAPKWGRDDE